MAKNNNPNSGMTKNACEKYGLAITNYVLGEAMGMTKEELFAHLKVCKDCRRDLSEWRDTHTVMKTEAYYQTAAGKAKMKRSFEDVKRQVAGQPLSAVPTAQAGQPAPAHPSGVKLLPGEHLLDHKEHIGSAAGVVWHWLGKYGKSNLTDLPQKAKLSPLNAYEAVGWLANEKKIYRSYVKQTTYAWLNEHEREIYLQEQAQAQV